MELWRTKNQPMARSSKPNSICKKHPKHQQSPGVCSICLSEKLSQLSKGSSRSKNVRVAASSCSSSSLSSSPSECSSCASSACTSPVYGRMASGMSGSLIFSRTSGRNHELVKSRSMAAVPRRIREREGIDRQGKKKKKMTKNNFWSKLLRPRWKRIDESAGLVHSRTMREMLPTRAH